VLVQVTAGWIGVAIYMSAIMLVSLITAIMMPETRGRDPRLAAAGGGCDTAELRVPH
jgi:hypothetical protein